MSYTLRRLYFAGASLPAVPYLLARRRAEDVFVLNFHRVEPVADPFSWPIHPALFERLLIRLKRHFRITTLDEAREADRPCVILSFDDGYRSFLDYVAPVLQRHQVRANLNVVVDSAMSGKPPWNLQVYDFLRAAPLTLIRELRMPGFTVTLDSDADDARTRFGLALSRYLKNRSTAERDAILEQVAPTMSRLQERVSTPMLRVEDLRQLRPLVELGAHSRKHESMGFESNAHLRDDCDECARFFREQLAEPLRTYAFPNGSYRREQVDVVRASGIEWVLVVDERIAVRGQRVVPRLTMYGHSGAELLVRACGYGASGRGAVVRSH